jgi:hypothetical protein
MFFTVFSILYVTNKYPYQCSKNLLTVFSIIHAAEKSFLTVQKKTSPIRCEEEDLFSTRWILNLVVETIKLFGLAQQQ